MSNNDFNISQNNSINRELNNNLNNIIQIEVDMVLMKKMSFIGTVQKVFGVLSIISGVIVCFGIISAIVGIPYIIAGVKLFKSGSAFTYAAYTSDSRFMYEAIFNLASFWMYTIAMIILVIVLYLLLIFFMAAIIASGDYYA